MKLKGLTAIIKNLDELMEIVCGKIDGLDLDEQKNQIEDERLSDAYMCVDQAKELLEDIKHI